MPHTMPIPTFYIAVYMPNIKSIPDIAEGFCVRPMMPNMPNRTPYTSHWNLHAQSSQSSPRALPELLELSKNS